MGLVKDWMMEQEDRGFSEIEGNVCSECFIDKAIKDFVIKSASSKECDFCGKRARKAIAAPFDDVASIIVQGIGFEWNNPDNEGIPYVTAEGGYQVDLTETYELIHSEYEISDNDKIKEALLDSIDNQAWVKRNFFIGTEGQQLQWGWGAFCYEVTHRKRFFFLYDQERDYDPGEIKPSDFLFEMADYKNRTLDNVDLIRKVDRSEIIYRVRIGKKKYNTASELGAPPMDLATRSNRMSPAGVPMFYGAFDKETAIQETYDPTLGENDQIISIGHFKPTRGLRFLDLAKLPGVPSVFDVDNQHMIHALRFFHGFAEDISKPVSRNGREHVEYVPTQVVTEFFRHIYRTGNGEKLDGIIYRSSKEGGQEACVIFCENEHACDVGAYKADGCLLELMKATYRKV